MDNRTSKHYMTISEFAAATQLSPKALRLYDQQGFLRPSIVDSANGYRYYTREQIAGGRIVRTLREMDLSLNQIAQVVAAGPAAERLLLERSREIDRRYARQKRAFQAALLLLRDHEPRDLPTIQQIDLEFTVLLVHPFRPSPDALSSRFFAERQQAMLHAEESELCADGPAMCAFTEHGTDEELALEVLLPIRETSAASRSITLRRMPSRRYAAVPITGRELDSAEIAALSDALFDWFDRAGHRSTIRRYCHSPTASQVAYCSCGHLSPCRAVGRLSCLPRHAKASTHDWVCRTRESSWTRVERQRLISNHG